MATALSEQLNRLAVPQTSLLKQDKKKASLLFDKKQAAEISREVYYQIALDGFEELKQKCALFTSFQNTLFHITSKEFERSVHDTVANEKLNKQIKKFFLTLSPYLSLTCAHKALEWLINRYSVHEYNRKDFVMLILPYHETNIFVRALQLIKIKDSGDSFIWLKEVQKAGVHLSKQLLHKCAAKNPQLLKEIGEFTLDALNEHDQLHAPIILINFYCTTTTGALEYLNVVSETYVTHILGTLLKGQKSLIIDFCASSYIITAKLLSKVVLSEKILNKFVDNISLIPVEHLKNEAILLLAILYQTQQHFSEISDFALRNFANKVWITKILGQFNARMNFISPMLVLFFKRFIEYGFLQEEDNDFHAVVLALLTDVQLEDSSISNLLSIILEAYKQKRRKLPDDIQNWIASILLAVENRYPRAFDKEVKRILKVQPGEKISKTQKCFRKLLVNNQSTPGSITRVDKFYHPVSDIRKATIKHYIKIYNELEENERQLINKVILDKLHDEDPAVVLEILYRSKKILPQVIDKAILRDALIKLLKKSWNVNWQKLSFPALNILCTISDGDHIHTFAAVLPFILPLKDSDMKIAALIINSGYFSSCQYFESLDVQTLKETKASDVFFDIIFEHLKTLQLDIDKLEEILAYYSNQSERSISKYVTIMLICTLIPDKLPVNISSLILDVLRTYISRSNYTTTETEFTMKSCLILAKQNQISLEGILHCIEILIKKTELSIYTHGPYDLCNKPNTFTVQLLDLLLSGCYAKKRDVSLLYASVFKKFFDRVFPDIQTGIEFLLNVCITNMKEINIHLQLRCVRTIDALLCTKKNVLFNEIVVVYMLIGMSNRHKEIRHGIINIVMTILEKTNLNFQSKYNLLFKDISHYKEEIILDDTQISTIMGNIFDKSEVSEIKAVISDLVMLINNTNVALYFRGCLAYILIAIDDFEVYNTLSVLAVELFEQNRHIIGKLNEQESKILYKILLKLDAVNVPKVTTSSNIYKMIDLALSSDALVLKYSNINIAPSVLCITHIHHVFEYFNNDVKASILNVILKIATCTSNSDVVTAARKIFKHIDLDSYLIVKRLSEMYDTLHPKHNSTKRRRVSSSIPTTDLLELLEWKKGIITLEFLQDKKKIRNSEILIPLLFKILKKCLDFDEQSNVEYPKQILLSTLLNCCTKIEDKDTSGNIFNVEVLVQCIRASQNPQTHHHALLVLAHTANAVPKQVLHHIMAIFTFMGSSVLRYDDAYTFQIINRIVDSIIPILVEDHSFSDIVNVLRVFVDAVLDVPEHRRMKLYHNLLEKLGAKHNMYLFILLMIEAHVLHINIEKQKVKDATVKGTVPPKRLNIAAAICRRFSPDIVIENCIKIVSYLQQLPEDKGSIANDQLPFDITHQTTKQYRHYKYAIITFISNLLSSTEFISAIAILSDENLQKLELVYKNMVISIVTYIQYVAKTVDKNKDTSQAHYWKTILHHSYDVLDSINALLTPQMFLLVIRGLTTHTLNHIRRRSLELLNVKLQQDFEFFSDCSESEIYAMIPALLNIIKQGESDENHLTVQTAFLSLKLFIKFFAKDNFEKFIDVLNYLTDFIKIAKVQANILASAVLCLSELCNHLRAHAISNLNKFMPTLLKILKINRHQDYPDLLLLSVITALLKILESLPLFLSSYLEKILYELSLMLNKWTKSDDVRLQPIIAKLQNFKQKIATLIPFRTLIPVINRTYAQIIQDKNYSSVSALTNILSDKISSLSSSEIQANTPELMTFFLNALRFRSDLLTSFVETNEIEKNIINAVTTFSLKLSESAFRPMYYKIYDWAIRHETKSERLITFYALSNDIANNLKSLFVLFAAHILNNAALLLDLCNTVKHPKSYYDDEEKSALLLQFVLKTLYTVFLYDTRKFVNKDRFDILMQPIVDQLENTLGSDNVSRAENIVIPCIVQFAVATADDTCWKQLNYQILLKMRYPSPTIRILSLKCLLQFATKLGGDFLSLLPETIPFLAELLEDENEEVEKICQKTVQQLEKILGEPLQKYF